MKLLEFKIKEMEELISQGDAKRINADDSLVCVYNNLYIKRGNKYVCMQQEIKLREVTKNG